MTISLIKSTPNLYLGSKIKKSINLKHSKLREKKYKHFQFSNITNPKKIKK